MSNFSKVETGIPGLFVIEVKKYGDHRGYFKETYRESDFRAMGIDAAFVQDNESYSRKNTLRGLHFQKEYPQGKLVRVIMGEVFDVAVDIRQDSPTYGKWHGVHLSGENGRMFYVPPGFAHGFLVLSEEAVFTYKCTEYYHPEDEGGFLWNDPELDIRWPAAPGEELLISPKDAALPPFRS